MLKEPTINRALKAFRVKQGLTQESMAKIIGIDKTTYHLKENGKRNFNTIEVRNMIAKTGMSDEEAIAIFLK